MSNFDAMDAAQIQFHEAMIEMYEGYAATCKPSKLARTLVWMYRFITGWFFFLGAMQTFVLHHPITGAINTGCGVVWIFLTRAQMRIQRKEKDQMLEWLAEADEQRAKLALLDPTNPHLTLIIEEEP